MKCADTAVTGWTFECLTGAGTKPPDGGLVLQDVKHQDHNFAKDIRLVGIWIETEPVESGKAGKSASKLYLLDPATFTVSSITELKPKATYNDTYKKTWDYLKEADAALDFTTYFKDGGNYVAYGVSAKYEAPTLLGSLDNCEYAGLTVEQIFLFSRYGKVPIHEPSGGLEAARCHPMVRYKFSKNEAHDPKKKYTRVRTIRFDYRLQLLLDRHHDVKTNAGMTQLGNQAGLFADSDSKVRSGLVGFGGGIKGLFGGTGSAKSRGVTGGAFTSIEKPLVLEVLAPGLGKGFSKFGVDASGGTTDVRAWDNVHWWGSRGAGNPIISTPGAFHCAHMHWRWGAAATMAGTGLGSQFNPTTYPSGMPTNPKVSGMWGPLVDPKIWIQTIRVAVTKNDAKIDPARGAKGAALTKEEWASLFDPGLRSKPDNLSAADEIVLWYSTMVHRDLSDSTLPPTSPYANPKVPGLGGPTSAEGGTVFIHGIFFAHSAEITGGNVGNTDPQYWPKDEADIKKAKEWTRPAE